MVRTHLWARIPPAIHSPKRKMLPDLWQTPAGKIFPDQVFAAGSCEEVDPKSETPPFRESALLRCGTVGGVLLNTQATRIGGVVFPHFG